MNMNVLFTSAGRRVELLAAFRRALGTLGVHGTIVAIDTDPLAPALREADQRVIVPAIQSQRFAEILQTICWKERIHLVIPTIDPDILFLSTIRRQLEDTGTRVAVVSAEATSIAADKWKTSLFFRRLRVETPECWLPQEASRHQMEFPLFIKPRGGSASKQGFKIEDNAELEFFMRYVPDPVIQEFLPGPEITTDVICSLEGELMGIVSRKRLEVRGGEVTKSVTVRDERIIEACTKIAHELPARGPITVQCIMKDGIPHFTEINARFGGGAPLGFAAGVDSPRWLLAKMAGIPVDIPPIGTYKTGLFMTRCDHSYFLEERDLGGT